ncbi:hypothetical protein [Streptomyces sp. H39-S7]|uniref:hypothetical protein n=1 Tax=Streptomyces sp. H39-S7 TaxID=3004357 RepID=UPI0022AED207|nr:hypothetical protein [Streptomyces sp. H39-S7]MCZ4122576.1 hypothetical protein [Streptomyces sp. H39-S7]
MSDEAVPPSGLDGLPILRSDEEMEEVQQRMSLLVGEVARGSAALEYYLRRLMTCLIDSRYAEVVAAGLGANELIDMCTALVKINREITEAQRTECRSKLATLKPLLARRNHLVHGMWTPLNVPETEPLPSAAYALVSKRRTAAAVIEISYEEAETLADELYQAGSGIFDWICRTLLVQLRREQVTEPPKEANGGGV